MTSLTPQARAERQMNRSLLFVLRAVSAASVVLAGGSVKIASAEQQTCPIATEMVVSDALGETVEAAVNPDQPRGMDVCYFTTFDDTDFAVERLVGAFGPDDPGGPAELARKFVTPPLSPVDSAQLDALTQVGSIAVSGHELAVVDGLGDYAVAARNQMEPGWIRDALLVQRGNDAYVFEVDDDSPNSPVYLRTVASAVIGSLPQQPVASARS